MPPRAAPAEIPAETVAATTESINAPLNVEKGFDPNCVRDQLQALMAPYWIIIAKNEATLQGALNQVEFMRDNVVPKLMARTPHELRLAHETKHKVLSAEMKLRAGLERKEGRGLPRGEPTPKARLIPGAPRRERTASPSP